MLRNYAEEGLAMPLLASKKAEYLEILMKRDGARCRYCGKALSKAGGPGKGGKGDWPHLEHLVARVNGGSNNIENFGLSCHVCNSAKRERSAEDVRHNIAQLTLGWPKFTRAQIAWLREQGFDLSAYDAFQFHFEKGLPCERDGPSQ